MIAYFDTSALIKLVVVEDGSSLAAELWRQPLRAASSILCYPEGRAALAAARRAGRLTAHQHRRAVTDFEAAHDELLLVGIDAPLTRHAGELAVQDGLRGYDAVHLATALALGDATLVVTWDAALGRAAARNGCAVAPEPPEV